MSEKAKLGERLTYYYEQIPESKLSVKLGVKPYTDPYTYRLIDWSETAGPH